MINGYDYVGFNTTTKKIDNPRTGDYLCSTRYRPHILYEYWKKHIEYEYWIGNKNSIAIPTTNINGKDIYHCVKNPINTFSGLGWHCNLCVKNNYYYNEVCYNCYGIAADNEHKTIPDITKIYITTHKSTLTSVIVALFILHNFDILYSDNIVNIISNPHNTRLLDIYELKYFDNLVKVFVGLVKIKEIPSLEIISTINLHQQINNIFDEMKNNQMASFILDGVGFAFIKVNKCYIFIDTRDINNGKGIIIICSHLHILVSNIKLTVNSISKISYAIYDLSGQQGGYLLNKNNWLNIKKL